MESFQLEATVRNRRTLSDTLRSHDTKLEDTLEPHLTELLFGLSMRGWLCDREKEFLDTLIDENEVTFLLRDGICLHPEGIPHLPLEQIESAHRCSSDATFAQRHVVELGRERLFFRVRTARLGTIGGHEMILGTLGRESRDEQRRTETRFAAAVDRFRKAAQSLEELAEDVSRANPDFRPALFVNRSSGRIIAINDIAREEFALDDLAIVGSEFSQARNALAEALTRGSLKMRNLHSGGLDLGVIMILPDEATSLSTKLNPPVVEFGHTIRNKITSILAAAGHLESILGRDPGNSVTELVRIIQEEATDLDRHAWRQQLVAEYPALPKAAASPVAELKAAVDLVSSWRDQCQIMLFEDTIDGCRVECPRSSLLLLFEALLRSHLTANRGELVSRISVRCSQSEPGVTVMAQTSAEAGASELQFHPDWRQYTERLAGVMEIGVNYSANPADNSLETLVTLK